MAGLFDQAQHLAQIPAPLIQRLIGRLLLLKVDNTRRAINLCLDGLVGHEFAESPFGGVRGEIEKFGETGERDLSVVGCYHSNVLWMKGSQEQVPCTDCALSRTCSMTR